MNSISIWSVSDDIHQKAKPIRAVIWKLRERSGIFAKLLKIGIGLNGSKKAEDILKK
jgi:hypothetical protein